MKVKVNCCNPMKVKVNCCNPMKVKVNCYNPKSLNDKMNVFFFQSKWETL